MLRHNNIFRHTGQLYPEASVRHFRYPARTSTHVSLKASLEVIILKPFCCKHKVITPE